MKEMEIPRSRLVRVEWVARPETGQGVDVEAGFCSVA